MVETSCTDLYSETSSKHGWDVLTCTPNSIVKALYLQCKARTAVPDHNRMTLSSNNSYFLMQEFIVFKYLNLQLRKFQLNLVFLQSAVIPWMLQIGSGPKQEMGNADTRSRIKRL